MMKKLIVAAGLCVLMSAPAFAIPTHEGEIQSPKSQIDYEVYCNMNDCNGDNGDYISAVPLPAAGWMLLAGIGGLVAMRRRARA